MVLAYWREFGRVVVASDNPDEPKGSGVRNLPSPFKIRRGRLSFGILKRVSVCENLRQETLQRWHGRASDENRMNRRFREFESPLSFKIRGRLALGS